MRNWYKDFNADFGMVHHSSLSVTNKLLSNSDPENVSCNKRQNSKREDDSIKIIFLCFFYGGWSRKAEKVLLADEFVLLFSYTLSHIKII